MIHHKGTKDTKGTKNNSVLLFSFVAFVSFVPLWWILSGGSLEIR